MNPLDDTRHCPMCEDAAKKILELEQSVRVLTDAITSVLPTLRAYEHCATSVTDSLQQALSQTPQQTAAQIERWHIEWMMKLPVVGWKDEHNDFLFQKEQPEEFCNTWVQLVAVPPLPKENKE